MLGKYVEVLTPFAFEYVEKQFELSRSVKILEDIDEDSCTIDAREGRLVTSTESCSCVFTSSMKLPCRHVFATRRSKSLSEYHEGLCVDRWKLQHFLQNYHVFQNDTDSHMSEVVVDTISSEPASKVLTEQEKYKKAFQVTQCLAQQLSTVGMKDFEEGLELLKSIKSRWDEGKKLIVTDLVTDLISGYISL